MITSTMTAQEIMDCTIFRDHDRIGAYVQHRYKEMQRLLKKAHVSLFTKCYEYRTPNADYILILTVRKKGTSETSILAYIKETNEFASCIDFNGGFGMVTFSMHLVKRFAERHLHNPDLPITSVWKKLNKNIAHVKIYEDNETDDFVCANAAGLFFGTGDRKRNILIYKTFVSLDMLHDGQHSAWLKVTKLIDTMEEISSAVGPRNFHIDYCQFLPDELRLSKEEAVSIYKQYADMKPSWNNKS